MRAASTKGNAEAAVIFLVASYVAAQLIANVASLKIAMVAGFSVDAGTFIYPLTFTLRDLAHKRLGRRAAILLILASGAVNFFMAGYLWLSGILPSDPGWTLPGLPDAGAAFAALLAPFRIVLASVAAMVLSELIDTETYHLWTSRVTKRFQWSRVLVSNAVSIPIDTIAFAWIAWGFELDPAIIWSIVAANILVKGLVTLVGIPLIYVVKEKPAEGPHA
jgi:hypothetical protein